MCQQCIRCWISKSVNSAQLRSSTLEGSASTFPNFPRRLITVREKASRRSRVPTILIEVADNPRRSAIGDAIRPNAYPVPDDSDLNREVKRKFKLWWRRHTRWHSQRNSCICEFEWDVLTSLCPAYCRWANYVVRTANFAHWFGRAGDNDCLRRRILT